MDAAAPRPRVDVRRADERFVTRSDGVLSRHCFSFGAHYDSANTSFGLLLASNDDVLQAGAGYPTHPHRDLEIVTWVLQGTLLHRDSADSADSSDSTGSSEQLRPGQVQRMSAGSGLLHSEHASDDGALHLVQMWVVPDRLGAVPDREQRAVAPDVAGRLVPVVSGRPEHGDALRLGQPAATLHAACLAPGDRVQVPAARYVHVYVARGVVDLEGAGPLRAGDAVRLTDAGVRQVTALQEAELLVWEMHGP